MSADRAGPKPLYVLVVGVLAALLSVPSPVARAVGVLPAQGKPAVACDSANAALGKPASASSVENSGTPASAAFDGNPGTRWSSAWSDPQWLQVDLGSVQNICKVDLSWETAYGKDFKIQASSDGSTFTDLTSVTGGTGGQASYDVSGSGRYVRIYGTARGTGYGYSLWEMAVHTSSSPTGGWSTIWSDTFDGPAGAAPDPNNWTVDTGTSYPGGPANWGTGEVETASTNNAQLDGSGHLNLTAIESNGAWTSGRVETKRADFQAPAGGQLKISATLKQPKVANGIGYWPAFRATGASYRNNMAAWPAMGESDIMADVNGRGQLDATFHCGSAPGGNCAEYNGLTSGLASCTGCQDGYHTYSYVIDRTESDEQIRWYLDDRQVWQVNESQVGISTWDAAVHHGVYLLFNLGIGGSFPNSICGCTGPSADTSSGGVLSVDTVTVAQQTGTAPVPLQQPPVPTGASDVHITGAQGNWQLTVNGAPYQIKGMTWGPNNATADAHMRDLQALGVNTVRTWGTDASTKPLLDAAAAYGLKVINGFWLNQGADYINDTTYMNNTLNTIKQWVTAYKDHPGVLMWDVGNEVILTMQDHYTGAAVENERVAYAKYVEKVVQAIHAIDPNHPVTSTEASQARYRSFWQYYKNYTPSLDLYAINSYGSISTIKQDWLDGGYHVPYIVTEAGEAGEWEVPNDANGVPTEPTDIQKRDGYTAAWNAISGNPGISLGGTMFNYGEENDFGGVWYNITPSHWKRLAYYSVAQALGGHPQANTPPVISSMTLSNTSSVPAGGTFDVTTQATDPDGDLIRYQLMFSSKYVDGQTALQNVSFTETGDGEFTVTAPKTLGVWKVYVYAFDGHGNVGIETRSFRVVAPPVNGTNVAKGKPTTASSYQAVGNGAPYPPSNATDGDWSTRWASDWSDPQWLQVDLGQPTALHTIQLGWEFAYGKAYQIQVSNDGTTWTPVYTQANGTGGVETFNVSATARYVRLNLTQRGTSWGYSLYEFGIYS